MKHRIAILASVCLTLMQGGAGHAQANQMPMVATDVGRLRGSLSSDGRIEVFKGIPFAAPPVGPLRWRPPLPSDAWYGVRDATRFSADCMQLASPAKEVGRKFSEDCLYLNIWTPHERRAGTSLPVLLWIYGGSFTHGGASQANYDGARLSARGIIVVTFNYRVGALGFMAHPQLTAEAGASGNYGIMDQLAALKWVRRHISAFGGDPARITIAGQSAGAISVNALMAAPSARGLFAGAIVQSGPLWGMSPPTRDRADLEALGERMMLRRGLTTIAEMRQLPAETLTELTADEAGPLALPFGPIIDGALLAQSATERFIRGEEARVPLLIGNTSDEFSQFVPAKMTPADFEREMRGEFGEQADRYMALYAHAGSADARRARIQSKTYPIHDGTVSEAELHARRQLTFLFRFERVPPGPDAARLGAAHGSDVAYMFDAVQGQERAWAESDGMIARQMADYWANFVKSGNPNGTGLPLWPSFDPARRMLMRFGEDIGAAPLVDRARIRASRRPHDVIWVERFNGR